MRISADPKSPHFYGPVVGDDGPGAVECFVDGVKNDLVTEADSTEGWADAIVRDAEGTVVLNDAGDGPKIERVHGRVEFRRNGEVLS